MSADLIFRGGRIYTMDRSQPYPEALAVSGDQITAVGVDSTVMADKGPGTVVLELRGRALLPGFYDAHQHQLYRGLSFRQVDGRAQSISELVAQVRERSQHQPSGTWIEAVGYDESRFAEGRHPGRGDLDSAAPSHPAFVTRTCGHVMVLNSLALAAAGIGRDTPDPAGGRIDRDPLSGEPTGLIREKAMERLRRVVPQPDHRELISAILSAETANLRAGVTSVWEPSIEPDHLAAYRELEADDRLRLRVTMAHKRILRDGSVVPLPEARRGGHLSTAGVKLFQDGAIAPRTAALSQPYVGEIANKGLMQMPQEDLDARVAEIHRAGLQASIHAIGDAAIDSALTSIERAMASDPRPDPRHRIEHCGLPLPPLPARLARLGVVAVLQPPFLHFHGDVYCRNLGLERSRWLYPIRTLLGLCRVAGSSDGPVVPDCRPLLGMRVAMTRLSWTGRRVGPEEAITLQQALAIYTAGAAAAAGEEGLKGRLAPGLLADLVVLGGDPAQVVVDEIDQLPVELVAVGGRMVFEA